jgi:multiple sugar transport system substrate-binding protein
MRPPAIAAASLLLAGCGLLPQAPGTLDSDGTPCGPAPRTSGAPQLTSAPGQITFAIGSDDIDWLAPLLTNWDRSHPKTRVLPLYLPAAANDQLAQLVANLQARNCLYDVIGMDVVWTAQFASSGWVIQLPEDQFRLRRFFQPAVGTARYQRHLYAVPEYTNAHLLYYRTDILARARIKHPPTTWAELAADASLARRFGLSGYAATLATYEGLTVNFADAVQSAGGSIMTGSKVTVDSHAALTGLEALVDGVRDGWIPQEKDLGFEETDAQKAFEDGTFMFMSNWPDACHAMRSDSASKVADKFDVAPLPGIAPGYAGSSSLGGANLAVSAFSRHQQTAIAFIKYLTSTASERTMFTVGGFAPVLQALYSDRSLLADYRCLRALGTSLLKAQPRPSIPNYDQASLAISSAVHQALTGGEPPSTVLANLATQLKQLIASG